MQTNPHLLFSHSGSSLVSKGAIAAVVVFVVLISSNSCYRAKNTTSLCPPTTRKGSRASIDTLALKLGRSGEPTEDLERDEMEGKEEET